MIDLEGYVDRALLFDLPDGYIDANEVFLYHEKRLCLDFNALFNFIDSDLDNLEVTIPEGIEKIYYSASNALYSLYNKKCIIKFPTSLVYFGTMDKSETNEPLGSIELRDSIYNYITNNSFNKSIFDFRKCEKLVRVADSSFMNFKLGAIYLPFTVRDIECEAFNGANIGEFIGEGVTNLGENAFKNAHIESFKISDRLDYCGKGALCFSNSKLVLSFTNVEGICSHLFGSLKEIYLPYNSDYILKYLYRLRDKSIELIENKYDLEFIERNLNNLRTELEDLQRTFYYKYNAVIYKYLQTDDSNTYKKLEDFKDLALSLFSLQYNNDACIYFYNSKNQDTDIKDRVYQYVGMRNMIKIYIEK